MGDLGDRLDVEHIVPGVRYGFSVEEFRVGANRIAPLLQVVRVLNKRSFNAEVGKRIFQ